MPFVSARMPERTRIIAMLVAAFVLLAGTYLFFWAGKGFNGTYSGIVYVEGFSAYVEADQYAYLADALIHGRCNLDLPVPDALAALDDPYSPEARAAIANGGENPIFFDHAFYKGKYYCYFGVVPAVLLYVPFQLLTGTWLNTSYAVAFLGVVAIASFAVLTYWLSRRFVRSATPSCALLVMLCMFGGSGVLCLGVIPRFYEVPMLTSLALTSFGLSLWLAARREAPRRIHPKRSASEEPAQDTAKREETSAAVSLNPACMFFGTLLLCMNLGSRPQFVLVCLLAFPLFWQEIARERLLFSAKGLRTTLLVLLAIVLVVAPLLSYNYVRFGSPFDFGSNYNLTTFNMTTYHQDWALTLFLLRCALLRLPHFTSQFPFVKPRGTDIQAFQAQHPGAWAPAEPMFGGYVWLVCVVWLVVLLPFLWRVLKKHRLAWVCVGALLVSAVIILVDIRTAGISQRYFSDYGLFLMIVVGIVIFALREKLCCPQENYGEQLPRGAEEECPSRAVAALSRRKWRLACVAIVCMMAFSAFTFTASLLSPAQTDAYVGVAADWFVAIFPGIRA